MPDRRHRLIIALLNLATAIVQWVDHHGWPWAPIGEGLEASGAVRRFLRLIQPPGPNPWPFPETEKALLQNGLGGGVGSVHKQPSSGCD
jgi:hypothetical protein